MTSLLTATGVAAALTIAFTTAATAETRLEMFERISEESSDMTMRMMVEMAVEEGADRATLEGALVPFEWNENMRDAGSCMLDAYDAELGEDGTDEMITNLVAFMERVESEGLDILEMADAAEGLLPEGMTDEKSMEITSECGMMSAQMDWMSETGFMEAMFNAMPE